MCTISERDYASSHTKCSQEMLDNESSGAVAENAPSAQFEIQKGGEPTHPRAISARKINAHSESPNLRTGRAKALMEEISKKSNTLGEDIVACK